MMKLDLKNCPKQADLTVFALDPRAAHAPFAPLDMPVVYSSVNHINIVAAGWVTEKYE